MAQLAIKGHSTRGKEVIEILEMLGGVNTYAVSADEEELPFTIRDDDSIMVACYPTGEFVIYTLEEFLEKFPYKVGDKVCFPDDLSTPFTINKMWWDENANELLCSFIEDDIEVPVVGIRTYKEETMKQIKIDIPKGYEFFGIDDDNKIVLTKKQYKYPKTYKECCDVLGLSTMDNDAQGYKVDLIICFQELLIARDAYWKIAGEEMGLDKPWEPDWNNSSQFKDVIICRSNNIIKYAYAALNTILAFPTEEMRDAFYENFKDLIEECKEFL